MTIAAILQARADCAARTGVRDLHATIDEYLEGAFLSGYMQIEKSAASRWLP